MDVRRTPRTLGFWPAAVLLLGTLTVAWTAAAAHGAVGPLLGWNAAWTTGALAALAGMLAARGAAAPAHRGRWTWWAGAAGLWLAGMVLWDVFSVAGFPASPNSADVGWWGFAALVIAGLLRGRGAGGPHRGVALIEGLPLIAAAMALTFAELWTAAASSPLPVSARVSALIYPVLYVSAAMLTLQAMVGGSLRPIRGPGARLVLLGIVVHALAFISWSAQLLDGTYVVGATLVDPLWIVGLLSVAGGGLLAAQRPEQETAPAEMSHRGGLLPAATFAVLAGALIHASITEPPLGAQLTLAAGLLICGGTLIARAMLLERRLRDLLALERTARDDLAGREAELARLNDRLREDSRRDSLTGLRNRRALVEDLPAVELAARRDGRPFAIAICDVDRFKAYNDHLGHLAGDQALRSLATMIRAQLRAGDEAYRYGGEELVLVLRDAGAREALAAAERVRAAVAAAALPHPGDPSGFVTVSAGVASGIADASGLMARADRALYAAKSAGRNRVVAAGEAPAPARRRSDHADADGERSLGRGGTAAEVPDLRLAAAMLLAETLDLRDAGTAEHSRTVGAYARDTAAALGLSPERVERLQAAGVLHDLGKLGVPDAILHKTGPLDDAEWREMRRHPEIGARILEHAGLGDIAAWVRAHHERLDGCGYPSGLGAAEIPLEARVLAVADAYEAMVADRPYRTGVPPEQARAELLRCCGTQFDPEVVQAFLSTLPGAEPAGARITAAA
jgi:diguanylate cyclase (GGDEF)-like protein